MRKFKKILYSFIFSTTLAIVAIIFVFFKSSYFQTFVLKQFLYQISKENGFVCSVKSVNVNFFKTFEIIDFIIYDTNNDTLAYIHKIEIDIDSLILSENRYFLSKISIEHAIIKTCIDSTNIPNYNFLIQRFFSTKNENHTIKKSTKLIVCKNIYWNDLSFEFLNKTKKYDSLEYKNKFNPNEIILLKSDNFIENFRYENNILNFKICKLSFTERCGFVQDNFSCEVNISKYLVNIFAINYTTKNSNITIDTLSFYYSNKTTNNELNKILGLKAALSTKDLTYFSSEILERKEKIHLYSDIKWNNDKIDIRNLSLYSSKSIDLKGDLTICNYQNTDSITFESNISELNTSAKGISQIAYKKIADLHLDTITNLTMLDEIVFKGKITASILKQKIDGNIYTKNQSFKFTVSAVSDSLYNNTSVILLLNSKFVNLKYYKNDFPVFCFDINSKSEFSLHHGQVWKLDSRSNYKKIGFSNFGLSNFQVNLKMRNRIWHVQTKSTDSSISFVGDAEIDLSKKKPSISFSANFDKLRFISEKIRSDSMPELKGFLEGYFEGNTIDDFVGNLGISDCVLRKNKDSVLLKSLIFTSENSGHERILNIESDFADVDIRGNFQFKDILHVLHLFISDYLPTFKIAKEDTFSQKEYKLRILNITADLKNPEKLNALFFKDFALSDKTHLEAFIRTNDAKLDFFLHVPLLKSDVLNIKNLTVKSYTENKKLFANAECQFSDTARKSKINNLFYSGIVHNDSILSVLSWHNNDSLSLGGDFSALTHFKKNSDSSIVSITDVLPTQINIADSVWNIGGTTIFFDGEKISVNKLRFANNKQSIELQGIVGNKKNDELQLHFVNLQVGQISNSIKSQYFQIEGNVNGELNVNSILKNPNYTFVGSIENCTINNSDFGSISIVTEQDTLHQRLNVFINSTKDKNKITLEGYYFDNQEIRLNAVLKQIDLTVIRSVFDKEIEIENGEASGNIEFFGKPDSLQWSGTLSVQNAAVHDKYLGTDFKFSTLIGLDNNQILISETEVFDKQNNIAHFTANAMHENFKNLKYNLHFDTEKFSVLNTGNSDTSDFYGILYASGFADLSGDMTRTTVKAEFTSLPESELFIKNQSNSVAENADFIEFTNVIEKKNIKKQTQLSNLQLDMILNISPESKFHFITNPATNDQIYTQGIGNLHFNSDNYGNLNIYGDYEILKGNFDFTIEGLYGKKFDIQSGSKLSWTGATLNPSLDITTFYKLRKVNLYDLTLDETQRQLQIPVNCYIYLTENMSNPNIEFGVETPDNDKNIETMLQNLEEDEINKQFLSLILLNRFRPLPGIVKSTQQGQDKTFTASDILSGRIGSELSVLEHDLDVGINYRQNPLQKGEEIELDFTTGFFNNRVEINGNIATGEFQNSTGNIVGDFNAEVKLSKNGRLKIKAFNVSNRYLSYETGPYTQGFGFFFRTEFDRIFKFQKSEHKKDTLKTNSNK